MVRFIFDSHTRVYAWTGCALMTQVLFTEGLFKQMDLGPGFKAPDPNTHDFQVREYHQSHERQALLRDS